MKQTARLRLALLSAAAITAVAHVAADNTTQIIAPDPNVPPAVAAPAGGDRTPPGAEEPRPPARRPYPFRGTIEKVDVEKRSVQLEGRRMPRMILVLDDTRLEKEGMPVELRTLQPGTYVTGSLRRNAAGREEAVLIRVAMRPEGPRGARGAAAESPEQDAASAAAEETRSEPQPN